FYIVFTLYSYIDNCTMFVIQLFIILMYSILTFCFLFQAEDGIRDRNVTGVQTCALPICLVIIVVTTLCPTFKGNLPMNIPYTVRSTSFIICRNKDNISIEVTAISVMYTVASSGNQILIWIIS